LSDLKHFTETAILRLGGTVLPRGEFYQIITPKQLLKFANILPKYEIAAFSREAAMRKRPAELLGLGHPLVDALISHFQEITVPGDSAFFPRSLVDQEPYVIINTLVTVDLEGGKQHREFKMVRVSPTGDAHVLSEEWLVNRLEKQSAEVAAGISLNGMNWERIRQSYEGVIGAILSQVKASLEKPVSARVRLLGVSLVA
jgi:hypothetical protein